MRADTLVFPPQVAPGGRLPLPLRWSRAEDIRLRPLPCRGPDDTADGTVSSTGFKSADEPTHEYSDCSVLVPASRCVQCVRGSQDMLFPIFPEEVLSCLT